MTPEETGSILAYLRAAFPTEYNREPVEMQIAAWHDGLSDFEVRDIAAAAREYVRTRTGWPEIRTIREMAYQARTDRTPDLPAHEELTAAQRAQVESLTPEQLAANRARIKAICEQAYKRMAEAPDHLAPAVASQSREATRGHGAECVCERCYAKRSRAA